MVEKNSQLSSKFRIVLLLMILAGFNSCKSPSENPEENLIPAPELKKGEINIKQYNFSTQDKLLLNGEWAFYWKKFVNPTQIAQFNSEKKFVLLPMEWKMISLEDGDDAQTFGYATYYLKINKSKEQKGLGLLIPTIGSAYRLWVNGKMLASMGVVDSLPQNAKPQYIHQLVELPDDTEAYHLVLQVSNYDFFRGGVFIPFQLGDYQEMQRQRYYIEIAEMFQMGCLFFMGVYHLLLYFFRRKDQSALFLSITVFFMIIRILITNGGSQMGLQLFPDFDFGMVMRLEYWGIYSLVPLSILFANSLFPEQTSRKLLLTFLVIGGLMDLVVLLTPPAIFCQLLTLEYAILPLGYFYTFYILIAAYFKKKTGAGLILIGYFIVLMSGLTDMLQDLKVIQVSYFNFTSLGMLAFMFCQASAIAIRFSKAFEEVEELTNTLEIKVKKRTQKIEKQNKIIKQKNDDILDSIYYAEKIQKGLMPTEQKIKQHLTNQYQAYFSDFFIFYRPRDIVSGDFYWFEEIEDEKEAYKKLFIAAVDCTGHGVPGAFMSTIGSILLNGIAQRRDIQEPARVLQALDKGIQQVLIQNESDILDGMDVALCMIDPVKQELVFSGARRPLFYFKNGVYHESRGDHFPIGGWEQQPNRSEGHLFIQESIKIEKGDVFYLFSDGYADQLGKEIRKKFMLNRFREMLSEIHSLPMDQQKEIVLKTFKEWKQNDRQTDDILVIGFRI